jgi:D-alanyl-D-alanine carboxypeptidase/D-alanyl-D-alanine-endopeptidase (penicillin-binding protein 4)
MLSTSIIRVPMKKFPCVAWMAALLFVGLSGPQRHAFCASSAPISKVLALPNASLLMEEDGHVRISRHPDRPMVPASTMKMLTALASIQRWGMGHRFHTDFHVAGDGRLWVKGWGDPYLVSEELDRIVATLKRQGLRSVEGLGLDDSLFSPRLWVAGYSSSHHPYDAPVTALAVNFNTISLIKKGGKLYSGESQTPLTAIAKRFGARLGPGKHRVNLKNRETAVRYFGELLSAKLEKAGLSVHGKIRIGWMPAGTRLIYRHKNSHDLRQLLASMLEYSNNFMANALFLLLAQQGERGGLDMAQARRAAQRWVRKNFGWSDYRIEDGAGLSRGNRLSARQLLDGVVAFKPYMELLPEYKGRVRAKTGTLKGVSCYAGFVKRRGGWQPFSLLINQSVPHGLRNQVAEALARTPDLARY